MARFLKLYPEVTRVLAKLAHMHQETQCVPRVLGKASRSPIPKAPELNQESPTEPLDATSTGNTDPIIPPDAQGSRNFQLLVDLANGLRHCQPMRRRTETSQVVTQQIINSKLPSERRSSVIIPIAPKSCNITTS